MDDEYERSLLKTVAERFLDAIIARTKDSSAMLRFRRDEIVWEIATTIYRQSGHAVKFTLVRDVVDARIQYIMQQQSAATAKSSHKNQRPSEPDPHSESRHRSAQTDSPSPKTLPTTFDDSDPLAPEVLEEAQRLACHLGGDRHKAQIFVRVRNVICEQLEVEASEVNLDSHLSNDLGGDEIDLMELVVVLEEEWEIEISQEESKSQLGISFAWSFSGANFSSGGEACIVRNIIELIAQKIPALPIS